MKSKVTFFIPTLTKDGREVCQSILPGFEKTCAAYFGGCTTTKASGTWKSSTGEYVTETVYKVECLTDRDDLPQIAEGFAKHIKEAANQESVLFEIVSDGNVEGVMV